MTPNERTAYQARSAKRRRVSLVRLLSPDGCCARCRRKHPHERLVIDHPNGRLWIASRLSMSCRAARYWREYKAGVKLRALCRSCSVLDGGRRYTPAQRKRRSSRTA